MPLKSRVVSLVLMHRADFSKWELSSYFSGTRNILKLFLKAFENINSTEWTVTKTCSSILWTFWLNREPFFGNHPYYLIQRENNVSFCLLVSLYISQLVIHAASREKTMWHHTGHFYVARSLFCNFLRVCAMFPFDIVQNIQHMQIFFLQ